MNFLPKCRKTVFPVLTFESSREPYLAISLSKFKGVRISYLKGRWKSGLVRGMSSLAILGPPTKLGRQERVVTPPRVTLEFNAYGREKCVNKLWEN